MSIKFESHIKVKNLDWSYGAQVVLTDVSVNIEKGKFYTILGPNGSGKTTLAKIITKTMDTPKNKVFLLSEDITKLTNKQTARKIATVPQNTIIDFNFSVILIFSKDSLFFNIFNSIIRLTCSSSNSFPLLV